MLRDRALQRIVRTAIGFAVGLAFWAGFTAPYASALAALTEPIVRAFESRAVTRLEAAGKEIVIDRSDLAARSAKPAIATGELSVNVILLVALFASNTRWWSNRNVAGAAMAVLLLLPVHVAALIVNIESIYALRMGPWSDANYGAFERNLWGTAAHFYSFVGAIATAFILWWALSEKPISRQLVPDR